MNYILGWTPEDSFSIQYGKRGAFLPYLNERTLEEINYDTYLDLKDKIRNVILEVVNSLRAYEVSLGYKVMF